MKRYGQVIRLDPRQKEMYVNHHKACWPEVLQTIKECNIRNYSIFLRGDLLFSYFEYHGQDFAGDMKMMAADPATQKWWKLVGKAQIPLEDRKEGEWWAEMEEVFHTD